MNKQDASFARAQSDYDHAEPPDEVLETRECPHCQTPDTFVVERGGFGCCGICNHQEDVEIDDGGDAAYQRMKEEPRG